MHYEIIIILTLNVSLGFCKLPSHIKYSYNHCTLTNPKSQKLLTELTDWSSSTNKHDNMLSTITLFFGPILRRPSFELILPKIRMNPLISGPRKS
jgi:hypothetical protein